MRNHTIQMKIYSSIKVTQKGVQQLVRNDLLKFRYLFAILFPSRAGTVARSH